MDEILRMSVNEMPGTEFDCSCGRRHSFSVQELSIRKGAIEDLPKMAAPFKGGKILIVYDEDGNETETQFENGITSFTTEKGKTYKFS